MKSNNKQNLVILLIAIVSLSIQISSSAQIPTNGLVGQWMFFGNAIDSSTFVNDGVVNGAALTRDRCGNESSAYLFDGVGDNIRCSTTGMSITNAISISAWVKTSSGANQAVVTKYEGCNTDAGYTQRLLSGFATTQGRNGTGSFWSSGLSNAFVSDGRWHHLVSTISQNTWVIWVDGVLQNSGSSSPLNSMDNFDTLTFGSLSNNTCSGWNFFDGSIDDIIIYNRVLTSQEIHQLYVVDCALDSSSVDTNTLSIDSGSRMDFKRSRNLKIFPNPSSSNIQFSFDSDVNNNVNVSIYNLIGKRILIHEFRNEEHPIISVEKLSKGAYFVIAKGSQDQVIGTGRFNVN